MKRHITCGYCHQRTEIEYGNIMREHHHPTVYGDGHVFWEICPARTMVLADDPDEVSPDPIALDRELSLEANEAGES